MFLLYQIVQVLRRAHRRLLRQQLVSLHFAHRAMRCRVAIQRYRFRSKPLTLDGLRKKTALAAATSHLTLSWKSTVLPARSTAGGRGMPICHGSSRTSHRPARTDPLARQAIPPLDEIGREALDPAHDLRVCKRHAAFGDRFDEVSKAQLVTQIPSNARDDDLAVEVATTEQPIEVSTRTHGEFELKTRGYHPCPAPKLHQNPRNLVKLQANGIMVTFECFVGEIYPLDLTK
ncbi:hypothetical protein B0G84_7768 [Paraburkholderia sp. BL8N3]|nr:hypothetical protein B0G84_7768 [Paraburkholderia sp. BL8N3]